MKKYIELEMELIVLQAQDVVTLSGFNGVDDDFGDPNSNKQDATGFEN